MVDTRGVYKWLFDCFVGFCKAVYTNIYMEFHIFFYGFSKYFFLQLGYNWGIYNYN